MAETTARNERGSVRGYVVSDRWTRPLSLDRGPRQARPLRRVMRKDKKVKGSRRAQRVRRRSDLVTHYGDPPLYCTRSAGAL